MRKLRKLYTSSYRARFITNILISYILAYAADYVFFALLEIYPRDDFPPWATNAAAYAISIIVFMVIFFRLTSFSFKYINYLSERIQEVTYGNYDITCEVAFKDELGMLAANINTLAKTLKENEIENEVLKENERIAYDAEREAVNQKNELITNVAHDLRTPLTTIIGYLDLIRSNHHLSSNDVVNYASIAHNKSLRLKSMMDNLFEFTKLESAQMKMNVGIINLSDLVMQIVDEFYPSFQEHHIKPVLTISHPNLYVAGDGQLLARVFDNLISNALKYGYEHSELKIDVLGDSTNITVKVMNKGETIAHEDLPNLFDKFYRTDTSRNTTKGGTGLGLAIAKNIVEMHKGQIFVTSHNQVTTFVVMLHRVHQES